MRFLAIAILVLTSGLLACGTLPTNLGGGSNTVIAAVGNPSPGALSSPTALSPCSMSTGVVGVTIGNCPSAGPTSGGGMNGLPIGIIIDTTTSGPIQNVQVFATAQGQSLYYFSKDYDTSSQYFDASRCPFNGANPTCPADWPPVMAAPNDPAVTFEANAPFPQSDTAQIMGWTSFARTAATLGGAAPGNQLAYNGHAVYIFTDAAGACNKLPADPLRGSSGDGVSCDPGDFTWHLLTTATGTTGP